MARETLQKNLHLHYTGLINLMFINDAFVVIKYQIEYTNRCILLNNQMPHPRAALLEQMHPWWIFVSINKWAKGKCSL